MIVPNVVGSIYCDYDGVLVDLYRGTRDVLGRAYDSDYWHQSGKDKRQLIREHPNFWANLPPTKDFVVLWRFISRFNPYILTAYCEWDKQDSIREKWIWNTKYTRVLRDHFHCVSREEKQLFATTVDGKPNILIDDFRRNIEEWEHAGGIGIHHTDALSTIAKLRNIGFEP
jgi:5'(3')-deoxyribonucleotidase